MSNEKFPLFLLFRFTIKIRAFRAKGIRQWKLAIKFHQKNLLNNYFNKWKTNYQKQLVNKKLLEEKCQEVTMRKYLMKWYNRKQHGILKYIYIFFLAFISENFIT